VTYDYDNLALNGRTRDDGTQCGFGGCRYSRPADSKDNFTHASPKLELQYRPSEAWQWHIAAADAYRAPQATELYRLQREQLIADLDEVSASHVEVGVKWSTEISLLNLSLYHISQSNVIIRDSDFFNVDGQKIESNGIELDFELKLGRGWSTQLIAAYAHHEYASDQVIGDINIKGNLVDTAPKLSTNLILNWQASDKLTAQVEVQHIDGYYLEPQNRFDYPGHTLANIRGQYQFNEQWSLSLRLLNLADNLYAERADYTSFTAERYFPGEQRSLFGEVRWQF
jgi:outer membrane receptor protein involved in Fe transport